MHGEEGQESVTKLSVAGAAWFAGLAMQLQQPQLPDPWWTTACLACGGLGLLFSLVAPTLRSRRSAFSKRRLVTECVLLALACAALALGVTQWRAEQRLEARLDPAFEGREMSLTGCVATLPAVGPDGVRFMFEVESAFGIEGAATALGSALPVQGRVMLSWYRGFGDDDAAVGEAPRVAAGECWRLPVRLKRPHGLFNPHAWDVELWAFERGVTATGTVASRAGLHAAHAPLRLGVDPTRPVERLRQAIKDAIERHVPDARAAGVLAALAIGDQSAIDRADWETFRQTGVAHLMAISGLHVTMFAALASGLLTLAWQRSPKAALRWPAPSAGWVGGVVLAGLYALIAGWGVPSQRTVVMLAVVAALRLSGLRWPWPAVMAAAAFAVTAMDPWAALQPGFWLSFVAVALLIATSSQPVGAGHELATGFRTQLIASVGLAPLGVLFFQQWSLVGVLANLVAVPVVTFVVTPLALLGVVVPPLWTAGAWIVQALAWVLAWMATAPMAWVAVAASPWWVQVAGLLGGLLAVLPLPWRLRAWAIALLVPMFAPFLERPRDGEFEAVVVDVGQGSAVLVRTRQHLMVYDTGPGLSAERNTGERVLLPLLRARGERRIDRLVISHRDNDHAGGAGALIDALQVGALMSSLDGSHALRQRGLTHEACISGRRWSWDGVSFDVLHPAPGQIESFSRTPNAVSCVLRVSDAKGRSLLLTGDIEAAQEQAMLQRGEPLASDVLLVPHHGSRTSSTDAWLMAVAPHTAVIQAGYRNRFGHPHPAVQTRLADHGIEVQRSDRCGAWTRTAHASTVCERERRRRYWHEDLGYRHGLAIRDP